ncbi:MAG TPA: invasion associated locus B family protein [Vicinamibacterales bacterium]|nr:invasion associated locus B family protein [Vicinamibacterales bacterium]
MTSSMQAVLLVWALALGQGTAATTGRGAAPQKDTGPDTTTATYGDWILKCQAVAGKPGQRTCELVQSIVIQGQTAPIAQLAFGRIGGETLYLTAVLPSNITLPSVVRVSIDEKDDKAADLPWTRCLQTGCYATLAMTDAILSRWRAQDGAGRLVFKSGSGQDTILPMSFRGLARALDALGKD